MLEDLSCLLATSDSSEGVDIPQCAYGEGYCRGAEVVWGGIAEDMTAISEPLLYRRNGTEKARIRGRDKAQLLQHEETGIDVFPPSTLDESVLLWIPCLIEDSGADPGCLRAPMANPLGKVEDASNLGQPVAGRSTHRTREGVDARPTPELP